LITILFTSCASAQDVDSFYKGAYGYFAQGNWNKAKELYQKAIDLKPNYWDAHYWLGKTLEKLGDVNGAMKEWSLVLQSNPSHQETFRKWRTYGPNSVRLTDQERQNLENIFLYQDGSATIYLNDPWYTIVPYAFLVLNQNDFLSSYLSARIFQWAGQKVSPLLTDYADTGYQRGLEMLSSGSTDYKEMTFQFLKDLRERYKSSEKMQGKINRVLDSIFAQQAGITPQEAKIKTTLELIVDSESVNTPNPSSTLVPATEPSFYIDTGNE
ncbi:MAG: tetratricopeptide repeat protein, partial [Atribacterota bacterium]